MALAFGEHRQVNTPSKRWHFSLWLIAGAHPACWGDHTHGTLKYTHSGGTGFDAETHADCA